MAEGGFVENKLLKQLECPICKEYFMIPIKLCETGHSVCSLCRVRLDKCPFCKAGFTDARNFGLEAVVEQFEKTCPKCKISVPLYVKNHTNFCLDEVINCEYPGCNWIGERRLIVPHFNDRNHKEIITSKNKIQTFTIQAMKHKDHYFWVTRVYAEEHYYWNARSIFGWKDHQSYDFTVMLKVDGVCYKVTQPCKRNSDRKFNVQKDYHSHIGIPAQLVNRCCTNITISENNSDKANTDYVTVVVNLYRKMIQRSALRAFPCHGIGSL